ncbi:hypothetical protein BKN38_00060 [Helicobacter sp. CLO-3]|uniref:hypothetical protein n=1 Tax=unclassified Helicobacter TaxID=2593540 RepID=UPI000805A2C1|nr:MULTISPECIES: hypothetical protein [unclassified Helicobacter]OBV28769.1 hypothetical protein BA723_01460 [Helicobacter sp. CLO-3]OHU85839.1 hypothetical protein BKN38_00060 [Helicobacter sp. CLO-3]
MIVFESFYDEVDSGDLALDSGAPASQIDIESIFRAIAKERDEETSGYYKLPFDESAISQSLAYIKRHEAHFSRISDIVVVGVGGSSLGLRALDSALRARFGAADFCTTNATKESSKWESGDLESGKSESSTPESSAKNASQNIARNATQNTTQNTTPARNLHFLEHTDPFESARVLAHIERIGIERAHFIIISKSGTTIETSSLLKYLIARYDLLKRTEHICCITDYDSPLLHFAQKCGIEALCIDKNVGGRFSVLSLVGVLPLCLLGYDAKALLEGARAMMEGFFARREEHILRKAQFLLAHQKSLPMSVLFAYGSVFSDINKWFVQLWGESLGKLDKHGKHTGLTPIALVGSIDQHSFLQLIVQGERDKFVSFLSLKESAWDEAVNIETKGAESRKVDSGKADSALESKGADLAKIDSSKADSGAKSFKTDSSDFIIPPLSLPFLESTDFVNETPFLRLLNMQKQATQETLQSQKIPLDSITLDRLDEWHLGALIAYFELLTSCVGAGLLINTYDQPGVEFGKKRLKEMFHDKKAESK